MALADIVEDVNLPPGGRVIIPGRGQPWVWDSDTGSTQPTVILLHGWTSTAALTWQFCLSPLAERFRVVAPDLRGHGRGIRSRRPFRLEDCADDVAGLIDVLGCGPVIVAGYSMGGPVAQLLWRRHPGCVAGLVLCATASTFGRRTASSNVVAATAISLSLAASTMPDAVRAAGMRRMAQSTFPGGGQRRMGWAATEWSAADPAGLLGAGAALLRFDSRSWVGEVDVPAAVIVTTGDELVTPARQRRLGQAIPEAVSIPVDGGHRVCVEEPGKFVPALLHACRHTSQSVAPPRLSAQTQAPAARASARSAAAATTAAP